MKECIAVLGLVRGVNRHVGNVCALTHFSRYGKCVLPAHAMGSMLWAGGLAHATVLHKLQKS